MEFKNFKKDVEAAFNNMIAENLQRLVECYKNESKEDKKFQ